MHQLDRQQSPVWVFPVGRALLTAEPYRELRVAFTANLIPLTERCECFRPFRTGPRFSCQFVANVQTSAAFFRQRPAVHESTRGSEANGEVRWQRNSLHSPAIGRSIPTLVPPWLLKGGAIG
jgi:hypothetical protein